MALAKALFAEQTSFPLSGGGRHWTLALQICLSRGDLPPLEQKLQAAYFVQALHDHDTSVPEGKEMQ